MEKRQLCQILMLVEEVTGLVIDLVVVKRMANGGGRSLMER